MKPRLPYPLLGDAGTPSLGAGAWIRKVAPQATFQAIVSGTGAVNATIAIEVSNDGQTAVSTPAMTITLTGTDSSSDGGAMDADWLFVRANVLAISGTGAIAKVLAGSVGA